MPTHGGEWCVTPRGVFWDLCWFAECESFLPMWLYPGGANTPYGFLGRSQVAPATGQWWVASTRFPITRKP